MLVWKGSVAKLIWHDLLVFLLLYYTLSLMYRYPPTESYREYFEWVCIYCSKFKEYSNTVKFLTGFYVTSVLSRYWKQFDSLPWPDNLAYQMISLVQGKVRRVVVCKLNNTRQKLFQIYIRAFIYTCLSQRISRHFGKRL